MTFFSLKNGSPEAFHRLFREYGRVLYVQAYKIVRAQDVAEDIVQEFFIGIWEHRDELKIHTSFGAYARRSISNACFNYLRRHKFTEVLDVATGCAVNRDPFSDRIDFDLPDHLYNLLEALPPRCREVFLLVVVNGMSYEEVAQLLHLSKNTVKVHMVKAYGLLRANW